MTICGAAWSGQFFAAIYSAHCRQLLPSPSSATLGGTMQSDHKTWLFFFEGGPAGYFEDDPLPTSAGRYRYVPYRSLAHLRLHESLKSRGPQRCHYVIAGEKCEFTVLSSPSYGLLELAEFDSSNSSLP